MAKAETTQGFATISQEDVEAEDFRRIPEWISPEARAGVLADRAANPLPKPTLPLCKDCRWMSRGLNARCLAPQNLHTLTSLVTGELETVPHMEWCSIHRMHDTVPNRCGASGRWFEPRESEQSEAAQ